MKMTCMLFVACIGAGSLCAQQADFELAPDSATPPAPAKPQPRAALPQSGQKPEAYIGVFARELPAELRAQLSLPEGFGLLVSEVLPNSPAQTAGIKLHDVLVKFEDQQLVNMEQLMALVHTRKKGDVVKLTVISGGKETLLPVSLGEHQAAPSGQPPQHGGFHNSWPQFNTVPPLNGDAFRGGGQGRVLMEQMERFQQEMREYQERIQEWSKNGGIGPAPQAPSFNKPGARQQHRNETGITMPPGTTQQQFNFNSSQNSSKVTRRDDSGEYSIKQEDGKKVFTARPKDGKEQSWPIDTEEQRQAVPQEFRDKLKLMDGPGSGVHIQINPGTTPQGGGGSTEKPAKPTPKGKSTSA